jgi:hypothetical protein
LAYYFAVAWPLGFDSEAPFLVTGIIYVYLEMFYRQHTSRPFRPLHNANPFAKKVIVQSQVGGLIDAFESIEINVVKREAALMFPEDNKRRTHYVILDAQSSGNPLRETRLPGAEITA